MHRPLPLVTPQGMAGIHGRLNPGEPSALVLASRGGDYLTVTLSAALLLGVVVFVLCRYAGLRLWHAVICIILGFYLASTSFAPDIAQFTESLFRLL